MSLPSRGDPDAHRRTRRDHSSETAEDYAEAIADIVAERGLCRVADLTRRFGVSHVTVTKTVARLVREGLATTEPYRPIELTARGKRVAQESRRRHEIVLRFLLALGVDAKTAAIDAEGIEHHVSPPTLKAMERWCREPAGEEPIAPAPRSESDPTASVRQRDADRSPPRGP